METWLLLTILTIWPIVNAQQCPARYNQSITGQCSSINNCAGTLLAGTFCEGLQCCVPLNFSSPPACVTLNFSNVFENSSRGNLLRKVFALGFNSAGICGKCHAQAAFLAIAATMTNNFETDESTKSDTILASDDNKYGNNQTGDGSRFRARGFFGLRGRTMYQRLQNLRPQYQVVANPESAALLEISIEIAALLWKNPTLLIGQSLSLSNFADGSFLGFSTIWQNVAGGIAQLAQAVKYYSKFIRNADCGGDVYPGEGQPCRFNATHNGTCVPDCIRGMEEISSSCGCAGPKAPTCSESLPHVQCCLDACSQELKMDLGILLDASGSVGQYNYEIQRNFTKELLKRSNVGLNKTHVGIINFSIRHAILTSLNTDYSLDEKLNSVNRAVYYAENTHTPSALEAAIGMFSYANGRRTEDEGVTPVIFVITDGQSNEPGKNPADPAAVLKNQSIIIVSVGVGSGPNINELHAICTAPPSENYFAISDYNSLYQKLSQFTSKTCSEPAPVAPNGTVTVDLGKDKYKFLKIEIIAMGDKILINITITIGKVTLFYSFTNRNPKDPADFIDYETGSTKGQEINSGSTLGKFQFQKKSNDNQITLVLDKPNTDVEFAYIGIKGIQEDNQFEVRVDDCSDVDCTTYSSASIVTGSVLSMIIIGLFHVTHYI